MTLGFEFLAAEEIEFSILVAELPYNNEFLRLKL